MITGDLNLSHDLEPKNLLLHITRPYYIYFNYKHVYRLRDDEILNENVYLP